MSKRGLYFFAFAFALIFAGLVLAQSANANNNSQRNSNETGKNMTYGQCVVSAVGIKNSCYEGVKETRETCINATNESSVMSQCKKDYKKDMKQCKMDFKASKRECIQKTKPKIWERMRHSFA